MIRQNGLDFTQKMCVFDGMLDVNEKTAVVFLICDDAANAYCILTKNLVSNSRPEKILPDLFSFLTNHDRHIINKFVEALIIIGNIKLVRMLGYNFSEINTLKHKLRTNNGHINLMRRELFRMCEDLTVEELGNLVVLVENDFSESEIYFSRHSSCPMEMNILYWIQEGYISDGTGCQKCDVDPLIKHLHVMNQHKLAENLEKVNFLYLKEEIYLNTTYKDNDLMENRLDLKCCMKLTMPKSVNDEDDDTYVMDKNNMGLCVIVNQRDFSRELLQINGVHLDPIRHGTNYDRDMLSITFLGFGYEIVILENLDSVSLQKSIKEILRDGVRSTHSSFVLCILSHGKLGTVYCVDGIGVPVDDLKKMMEGDKCPKLLGKPKILIIQACQGNEFQRALPCMQDKGEDNDFNTLQSDGPSDVVKKVPPTADILTYCSTVSGYASFRHPFSGSVFIQTLCAQLLKHGGSKHYLDIITAINHELSQKHFDTDKVVMPEMVGCTITKKLIFPYSAKHRFKAAEKLYLKYVIEHLIHTYIIQYAFYKAFKSSKQK